MKRQASLFEQRGATFSADRVHRYTLFRTWGAAPPMTVIGLNPSTADEDKDDPTIRRCIGFAKRDGFGGVIMLNLFAFRSTAPEGLLVALDAIGPENDRHILEACTGATRVVAAWGSHKKLGVLLAARARKVAVVLALKGVPLRCFGVNQDGQPKHPLYLASSTPTHHFTAGFVAGAER